MPVGMLLEIPGATSEQYDALNREMDMTQQTLPDGLVSHVAGEGDGTFVIFDVWVSREAFEGFVQERLMPVMHRLMGDQAQQFRPRFVEIHNEFHGRVH